ncbi:MAG: hypothetical protein LBV17_06965 [Treponema sp.]|jgi:hypothetical protein|nr:hypothetical protein [Treponema sp.]
MKDPELVKALDYILNHSNEASIEVLAEAVVRRRRDLMILEATGTTPDPRRMANEITEQINAGVGGGIESMKKTIREMIVRVIKENAPELSAAQIDELSRTWLPERPAEKKEAVPRDMLISMIEQFVSFSRGAMKSSVDKNLRAEMGAWPQKYWNAFDPVIRSIITDFLKDRITEKEFNSKIGIALKM